MKCMANNKYSKNMSDYQAETQHWPKNGSSFSELQENFHGVQTTLTSDRQHSYSQLFFFFKWVFIFLSCLRNGNKENMFKNIWNNTGHRVDRKF